MTLPGTALLAQGLREQARTNLVLKLFLILDCIEHSTPPVAGRQSGALFDTLRSLKGRTVYQSATGFLWYSVHIIHEKLDAGQQVPLFVWRLFLAQIADSLFPLLRDGDTIELPDVENREVVLPQLGIKLPYFTGTSTLRRVSAEELEIQAEGSTIHVSLKQPGAYGLTKISVPPAASVLNSTRGVLADDVAESKVAHLEGAELDQFVGQLSKALTLIATADPALSVEISATIKWYWPIETQDKRIVHNSFSVSALHGGIFLSDHYSYPVLAEALVHEFYHNQLSFLMTVEPHLKRPDDATLYSPWRTDPRPLFGLYHGLYVFTGLLEYYLSAEQNAQLKEFHTYCRSRREFIYFQVRTGITQVPSDRLNPRGAEILEALTRVIEHHGQSLGLAATPTPESQLAHWQQWVQQNPQFVRSAYPPVGRFDCVTQ